MLFLIIILACLLPSADSFSYVSIPNRAQSPSSAADKNRRHMARLYEDPLPPRRRPAAPKVNNNKAASETDDDDDDDALDDVNDDASKGLLFQFDSNGVEVNGRLPNLGRSLASDIPCYFEASDRKVLNLIDKTLCHVDDACWALEACKGDVMEAWTCISMARRLQYTSVAEDPLVKSGALDKDVYDLEIEEEYEERKDVRRRIQRQQDREDMFKSGEQDQSVWPNFKPGPDEGEPWFTG